MITLGLFNSSVSDPDYRVAPAQPRAIVLAWRKLVLSDLAILGLPRGVTFVIAEPEFGDHPTLRLMHDGYKLAQITPVGNDFQAHNPVRLFHLGRDWLLAYWTYSGDSEFVNFVKISAHPTRLKFKGRYEYPTVHGLQATGRFEEHRRMIIRSSTGLDTRYWEWSSTRHRFLMLREGSVAGWEGWDDKTLR